MKERPILFSAPMVRAILEGRKTQTRRVVTPMRSQDWLCPDTLAKSQRAKPVIIDSEQWAQFAHPKAGLMVDGIRHDEWSPLTCIRSPYGKPGDRLWVREAFQTHTGMTKGNEQPLSYRADENGMPGPWRPAIHMPRWASRLLLEITDVRVERLQDISEADADAEGSERLEKERYEHDWKICPCCGGTGLYTAIGGSGGALPDTDCMECDTYVKRYRNLWEAINGDGAWAENPWVWVIEFKRVDNGK